MDDPASRYVWAEHQAWLRDHQQRQFQRCRWTAGDWQEAQQLSDELGIERAVTEVHYRRGQRWLASQEAATRRVVDILGRHADSAGDMA